MKKLLLPCIIALLLFGTFTASAQKQHPVLNHIALYVFDLKKSTDFYRQVIQLDTVPEPFHDNKHTWLSIGSHSFLHLIQGAQNITPHDKNTHLCFNVSSVDAFIDNLNKASISYEDWPGKPQSVTTRVDGVKQIYFKDPDGYWIEVNDARE